jgi:hypothetical protein
MPSNALACGASARCGLSAREASQSSFDTTVRLIVKLPSFESAPRRALEAEKRPVGFAWEREPLP